MKVFLTGASGILGTDLLLELENENYEAAGFNSTEIDIANRADVKNKMTDFNPDIVIHAAAMTNVDLCEDNRENAFRVNVIGSQNMAACANDCNAPLIYISSCGVYGDQSKIPHTETDETKPLNFHHFTKLEGEKRIKNNILEYLIVRPGWLFGGTPSHKKNFVEARRKEAASVKELKSASDKCGSPTYTRDLAQQIIRLIKGGMRGTFNVANTGTASRFDYVSAIIKDLGINVPVVPASSKDFPRRAQMPDNEMLENARMNYLQINGMRPWQEALSGYISDTY